MAYQLSERSLQRLEGVLPPLANVVRRAIELTRVDFGVTEGLRSIETQRRYVEAGKSQTLNSKHLTGEAVDLFAWVNGAVSWDLPMYDAIAEAMRGAALEQGVALRWGGAWNVPDITQWDGSMSSAMQHYVSERKAKGRRPFIDGPHFELA